MIVLLSFNKYLLSKTQLTVSFRVYIDSYCELKKKVMIVVNSSGSFSTLNANNSLLNSRKGRPFLSGGSIRRFQNSNMEVTVKEQSLTKKAQFKAWLKKDIAKERKVDLLILAVSVLLAKVLLMAII